MRKHNPFFFYFDEEQPLILELKVSPLEAALGEFIDSDVPVAAEVVFVDGEEIRRLNREQRNIDSVTDVLSFPALDEIKGTAFRKKDFPLEIDEAGNLFLGSVVICRQRAKEQAEEYGHSYERELHYLLVHGVMHCLGYDHMEESEKAEMRAAEESVLEKVGITREGEEV
ncbi:MAG: rRNA maturation RNase YbeY [Clostridia bacterium]|nr:rRNA maturation RNase YbeY [Clostridia bacterium]